MSKSNFNGLFVILKVIGYRRDEFLIFVSSVIGVLLGTRVRDRAETFTGRVCTNGLIGAVSVSDSRRLRDGTVTATV